MTSITIDTIPKSFLRKFGPVPKDEQVLEYWINNLWNIWLTKTSEKEKYTYRLMDRKFSNLKSFHQGQT